MCQIDLSICIVNWNAGRFLLDCIASIHASKPSLLYEIIVVDNASTDGSIEQILEADFADVKMIANCKNNGFAAANNIAISNAIGKYVLLLNPDTLVFPDTLETLLNYMETHQNVAVCGPQLYHPVTRKIESSARSFPTLLPLFWNLSYIDRLFPQSPFFSAYMMNYLHNQDDAVPIDWLTGACLFVRRKVILEIGGLDERFFMYCEDIEWCYRFKQAGWQIVYLPSIGVAHYRGKSSKLKGTTQEEDLSVWGVQQYVYSILHLYQIHFSRWHVYTLRLILLLTALWKALLWLTGGTIAYGWPVSCKRTRSYLSAVPALFTQQSCG